MRKAPTNLNIKVDSRLDNITLSTEMALSPAFMRLSQSCREETGGRVEVVAVVHDRH